MAPSYLSNPTRGKIYSQLAGRFSGTRAACRRGHDLLADLARAALPQHCAFCAAPCDRHLACAACEQDLPRVAAACPVCGLPVTPGAVCGQCLR